MAGRTKKAIKQQEPEGEAKKEPVGTTERATTGKAPTRKASRGKSEAPAEGAGSRARAVKNLLAKVEETMTTEPIKATLGDYIRLVQLHKELDEEEPKEIKVTWVEPEATE